LHFGSENPIQSNEWSINFPADSLIALNEGNLPSVNQINSSGRKIETASNHWRPIE